MSDMKQEVPNPTAAAYASTPAQTATPDFASQLAELKEEDRCLAQLFAQARKTMKPTSLILLLLVSKLTGQELSSSAYGVYGDAKTVTDVVTTAASKTLTSATGFAGCQIGMDVHVAGPSSGPLLTAVTACASNSLTIRDAAKTAESGLSATYGHNDTAALQNAINAAAGKTLHILRPIGKYWTDPLKIPSNSRIVLDGVTIRARGGFSESQCLISIQNAMNVTILGNGSIFEMPKQEYTSGEHRHCLAMRGVNGVLIDGITCAGSGGDGFYIGSSGSVLSSNLVLQNSVADDSRRQGLSIISGRNVTVQDSTFKRTRGTDPQYGIDIEPNDSTDVLQGIRLFRVSTSDNAGAGIGLSLFPLNNTSAPVDITITDAHDSGSLVGFTAQCNWSTGVSGVSGLVLLDNFRAESSQYFGIYLKAYQVSCPHMTIRSTALSDVYTVAAGGQAIGLNRDSGGTEAMGNVDFNDLTISDTRSKGIADYFLFHDGSGKGFASMAIANPHFSGATNPSIPSNWSTMTTSPSLSVSTPPAPATPSPDNGAQNVSRIPTLSWSASTGASSYTLYGGVSATALSPVTTTTTTSYRPGTLSPSTRYYWKVVAANTAGNTSSPVWSFTTIR